eukprot:477210_1
MTSAPKWGQWLWIPRDYFETNSIPLRVEESTSYAAGQAGPTLSAVELNELDLDKNIPHTKIQMAYDEEYSYLCCWGWILSIFCFPCIFCIIRDCYMNLKQSQTIKALVTVQNEQAHLKYSKNEVSCCGKRLEKKIISIPLKSIIDLHSSKRGCLEKYFDTNILEINVGMSYQPYAPQKKYSIPAIANCEDAAKLIYSTQSYIGINKASINTNEFRQVFSKKEALLFWTIAILLGFIAYFANLSIMNMTPTAYDIIYIVEKILLPITFLNTCIISIILMYQFKKNKENIISRLSIKFGLLTPHLRCITVLYMFSVIIYIIHRFVFVIYDIGNNDHKNYKMHQIIDVMLHMFMGHLFCMLSTFQAYQALRYSPLTDHWIEQWILHIIWFTVILIVYFAVCSMLFWPEKTVTIGVTIVEVHSAMIGTHVFLLCLFWIIVGVNLIGQSIKQNHTLSAGIRKTESDVFNHKLYNIVSGVMKHFTLLTIYIWITVISFILFRIIPCVVSIELFITTWCLFLMYWGNNHLYKRICGCCISVQTNTRKDVNFQALFIETNPNIQVEILNDNTPLIIQNENNANNAKNYMHPVYIGNCESYVSECNWVQMVINTLKYYQANDAIHVTDGELIQYCNTRKQLLDAYIHIIIEHNNEEDLQQIFDLLITDYDQQQCNKNKCLYLIRHNRNRSKIEDGKHEILMETCVEYTFYRDLLDTMHCYLYHLYDTGFRKKRNVLSENDIFIEEKDSNEYLCGLHQKKNINKTNNKFNIDNNDNQSTTFIDGLITVLQKSKHVSFDELKTIQSLFQTEQYDSDSIKEDIKNDMQSSNIGNNAYNKNVYNLTKQYAYRIELHERTFNIGYRFYYWPYYKTQQIHTDSNWNNNSNDGYYVYELYIEIKYESLKQEILNNNLFILQLQQYDQSVIKINKFINTDKAKQTKSCQRPTQRDPLQYGITANSLITFNHLLAITLYCDWSELARAFSKSFRKTSSYQPIIEVKEKNSEYGNWSKLIRESVEYFGWKGFGDVKGNWMNLNRSFITNELIGPFFCGMSFIMIMPSFNIRLCGPTSTSRQKQVATKFGGDKGIIMQLNNNCTEMNGELRGFYCSWLSNYPQEDEVLFAGGEYRIRIESVFIIDSKQKFEKFVHAFYFFDCMLNGSILGRHQKYKVTENYFEIINNLIKRKLKGKIENNIYSQYIHDTFASFTDNKYEIFMNLHEIDTNLNVLSNLILYPLTQTKIFSPT